MGGKYKWKNVLVGVCFIFENWGAGRDRRIRKTYETILYG